MALRLTGTSLAPEHGSAPTAAELAARAVGLIAAGDFDGYTALFARVAEHEDPHRRYQVRVALLQEGLKGAASASATDAVRLFATVAAAAIDVLEEEPREPVLLNFAGVALYELWSLDAAGALFRAAQRLDPGLPFVERNLTELKHRRRANGGRGRAPLHAAVRRLAPRAKRIAAEAQPAPGLKLSLCMIVRDEEAMLPRCLEAAAPAVDEIVVVDTGSTDRTIEIAKSFGARVIEREWTGSFADARNASFDAATGDWLMFLDADEVLVAEDANRLRALTGRTWREAFYLVEHNHIGEAGDGIAVAQNALRIFRNRPEYRFEGRIHEQIAHRLPTYLTERTELTAVRIEHYGYLRAVRDDKEKSRRNIELLRSQQAESGSTPFLHYNLGSEFAAAGNLAEAVSEFERALELLERAGEQAMNDMFVPSLVLRHVQTLRACGRPEDAVAAAAKGLERFPDFTDLVFEQGSASRLLGRKAEAIALYERCIEMGDAPSAYMPTVGCGTYLPNVAMGELHLDGGDVEHARELLESAVEDRPGFSPAVVAYATALLRGGTAADAVAAEVERRVPEPTPGTRFMLASVLSRSGAAAAAEQQYRAVLASRPRASEARVALAEALIAQRRYMDAAIEASEVSTDDSHAALAVRIELWGLIAAGELGGVPAALDRAHEAGVPAAELEAFAAWATALAGQDAPQLPITAAPLLGVLLETELRIHDFETFEKLVGLLERSALPRREQRELLAGMYLGHGFLASAAKEWMAVCQEQPDARAMLGLARVAAADGRRENAATFASEALRLDPLSSEAGGLLAATR